MEALVKSLSFNNGSSTLSTLSEDLIRPVPSDEIPNFPECDYDENPTELYKAIEAKKWDDIKNEISAVILECLEDGGFIDEAINICETLLDRCCPKKEKKFIDAVDRALLSMKVARNLM